MEKVWVLAAAALFGFVVLLLDRGRFSQLLEALRLRIQDFGVLATIKFAYLKTIGVVGRFVQISIRRDNVLHIAFAPYGGLGDYIISAKILEELLDLCICEITVYVDKLSMGKAIYGGREHVDIKPYERFDIEMSRSDLAISVDHFVNVRYVDYHRVQTLSEGLYSKIRYITDNWNRLYPDIHEQAYRECVHFQRCKVLGLDRWTELRMGEAFDVSDKRIGISLQRDMYSEFQKLTFSSSKFITINCETDSIRNHKGKQTKSWPTEYFGELCKLMKQKYPDIQIVQLGPKNGEKIEGTDVRLLGESFELVKWILKNSTLHVDCEGGLVHLATQLDTKCLVLFGPTPMHMYAYAENMNLHAGVCDSCMGTGRNWAYECSKGKAAACMRALRPQIVFESIDHYLNLS